MFVWLKLLLLLILLGLFDYEGDFRAAIVRIMSAQTDRLASPLSSRTMPVT